MWNRCTKFRFFNIFNLIVLFCIINFFIYRFFTVPKTTVSHNLNNNEISATTFGGNADAANSQSNTAREATPNGGGGNNTHPLHVIKESFSTSSNKSLSSSSSSNSIISSKSNNTTIGKKPPNDLNINSISGNTDNTSTGVIPQCPLIPPKLNGPLATFSHPITFAKIVEKNPGIQPGGRYKPPDCISRHRVAIVIPYRNREEHLQILLNNLHPMLMRQQLDYGIFVIDQALPTQFNRAMLMNIGYAEAMKRYDYQCAIFHDVDLIPENDRNIYSCPEMPRHLSAAIDKFRYRLPYAGIYGGVSAVNKQQFEKINGFSNMFFGWGGEDDDMATRIRSSGLKITRYPMDIARYRMIKHVKDKGNESNPQRYSLLRSTGKRMKTDGLNSLKYTVQDVDEQPTHLRIKVFINKDEIYKP